MVLIAMGESTGTLPAAYGNRASGVGALGD